MSIYTLVYIITYLIVGNVMCFKIAKPSCDTSALNSSQLGLLYKYSLTQIYRKLRCTIGVL